VRRFFVYSTPRSGSAWLSNFLTYGGSFCQHEPLVSGQMTFTAHAVSGAVDTGAVMVGYIPPPECKIFHLYRDVQEVGDSLRALGLPTYDMSKYRKGFEYARLFDVSYLEWVWWEVTGLAFDKARAEMLIELNIQRSLPSLVRRLRRH